MDWRNRKYFLARLDPSTYKLRVAMLMKCGAKLHAPYNHIKRKHIHNSVYDGDFSDVTGMYYVNFMLSCKPEDYEIIVYELNKARRMDEYVRYVELNKDMCG